MAGREVQTQIELGLAGRQTIPSGGFQYLQLGVFMRRPEIVDISRAAPRRVHDLHRRRTRRRLHRALGKVKLAKLTPMHGSTTSATSWPPGPAAQRCSSR
jgi:hypothetical protein